MTTGTGQQPAGPSGPLEGRVALITGGIGAAISGRLAADNGEIAAGYWRDPEAAEKFLADLHASYPGHPVSLHSGNIGHADDCRRVVREVIEQHGRLDITGQIWAVNGGLDM